MTDTPLEVKLISRGAQQAAPVAVPAAYRDNSRVPDDYQNAAAGYRAGWNDCRAAILSAAPAPPAQQIQWVPVSERLPEIDTPVFLYEPNFGIWIGGCADADDGWMWAHAQGTQWFADGKWKADLFIDDDYKPSHWMPLPAAPGDTAAPEQAEQPNVAGLVKALKEIIKQYPNPDISHVDYRVHACKCAESALSALAGKEAEQHAVKVPRELLERAANRFSKAQIFDFASELRALLGDGA